MSASAQSISRHLLVDVLPSLSMNTSHAHAWSRQAAQAASSRQGPAPASTSPPGPLSATVLTSSTPNMLMGPNAASAAPYYDPSGNDSIGHMAFHPHASASSSIPQSILSHLPPRNASSSSKARESHESKRIKVESTSHPHSHPEVMAAPLAMDNSILDSMVRFDEDHNQFRSFEIDYSKIYGPTGQARFMTEMVPRLGSGFYVNSAKSQTFTDTNAPAPVEEDFADDNAFDRALSDDEETHEIANLPEGPSAEDDVSPQPEMFRMDQPQMGQPGMDQSRMGQPHVEQPQMEQQPQAEQPHMQRPPMRQPQMKQPQMGQPQMQRPQMQQPQMEQPQSEQQQPRAEQIPTTGPSSATQNWDRSQFAMPPSTMGMAGGPMWESVRQGSASTVPIPAPAAPAMTGNPFVLSPEERHRLIEIALGPSGLPMYMPPSSFNFNTPNDYLYPPMPQANPMTMRFGIGNDPAALRLLSTDSCASEPPPTPHAPPSAAPQAQPVPAGAGPSGVRDLRARQQHYRHHPRIDTTTAGVHARASSAASRRALADLGAKGRSVDRVAHNDVERKYRTNLRDKIAELRNAVPVLRQAYDSERSPAAASSKVSKGTVLTKATEYIHHLEQRNRDIMSEHQQLTHRLQAFETLLHSSLHAEMIPSHSMALFDPRGFC